MPFEISEDLVSLAYQSLGYFVIEGRKVGLKEIDLLAIRLGQAGEVKERLHVEVQIGVSPIGVLRARGRLEQSDKEPHKSVREWMSKKFEEKHVLREVTEAFSGKPYRRVFVHGRLKDSSQLVALREADIECVSVRELVQKAYQEGAKNSLHRAVGIALQLVGPEPEEPPAVR